MKIEYMVLRKVTSKRDDNTVFEPYVVLAGSPLEAAETVAAELYATQSSANQYTYGAHTLGSISWYDSKTQVTIRMTKTKLAPMLTAEAKVGEAE